MKLAIAQIQSLAGDISQNLQKHVLLSERAGKLGARLIVFPELSLTGYEPRLAKELATSQDDARLRPLQILSDTYSITICAGMPIRSSDGIKIGMIVFAPKAARKLYCKQLLHSDELAFFVAGSDELMLRIEGTGIAPAICYESLQIEHAEKAAKLQAQVYLASVAKSARGVEKGFAHYPTVAKRFSMPVLMANNVGPSDDFVGHGHSAVWSKQGELLGQLGESDEGLLMLDLETEAVSKF